MYKRGALRFREKINKKCASFIQFTLITKQHVLEGQIIMSYIVWMKECSMAFSLESESGVYT